MSRAKRSYEHEDGFGELKSDIRRRVTARDAPAQAAPPDNDPGHADWSLVVGESGGGWAQGISIARRFSPNLKLVTQWVGESPDQFAGRVTSRIGRHRAITSVVLVCGDSTGTVAMAARADMLRRCLVAMAGSRGARLTLVCSAEAGREVPCWAHRLTGSVGFGVSTVELAVELAAPLRVRAARRAHPSCSGDDSPDSASAA